MRRMMLTVAVLCALVTQVGFGQQPPAVRFEVASIKPWSPPTKPITGVVARAPLASGGIFNRVTTVAGLIATAYGVQSFQLIGGEDWVRTERYDVAARAGREVSWPELQEMVKVLLADRFQLRVRTETRELPILELRLARSDGRVGPNLHDCSNRKDNAGISTDEKPFTAPRNGTVAASPCGDGVQGLASLATSLLQIIVVDKSGLAGQWRLDMYYGSTQVETSTESDNRDLPSFEGALREQLGLRLERTRGPAPVIVIESVARPTPN